MILLINSSHVYILVLLSGVKYWGNMGVRGRLMEQLEANGDMDNKLHRFVKNKN